MWLRLAQIRAASVSECDVMKVQLCVAIGSKYHGAHALIGEMDSLRVLTGVVDGAALDRALVGAGHLRLRQPGATSN